jgi:hypothetical protein
MRQYGWALLAVAASTVVLAQAAAAGPLNSPFSLAKGLLSNRRLTRRISAALDRTMLSALGTPADIGPIHETAIY